MSLLNTFTAKASDHERVPRDLDHAVVRLARKRHGPQEVRRRRLYGRRRPVGVEGHLRGARLGAHEVGRLWRLRREVERELNAWLGASFLPKAEATIKARRRKGK